MAENTEATCAGDFSVVMDLTCYKIPEQQMLIQEIEYELTAGITPEAKLYREALKRKPVANLLLAGAYPGGVDAVG
jgi:hypothetical protein